MPRKITARRAALFVFSVCLACTVCLAARTESAPLLPQKIDRDPAPQAAEKPKNAPSGNKKAESGNRQEKKQENRQEKTLPKQLASSWEELISTLTEALPLRDKQETLPDTVWFGDDKASNAQKINALLDRAIGILLCGDAEELRRESNRLKGEVLPALLREREEMRNKLISAPESADASWVSTLPGLSAFVSRPMTRSEVKARLAELDGEIRDKERAVQEIRVKIASSLREIGTDLSGEQLDILLTSVTGDDLLQNTVIFANVKHVLEKLAEFSRDDLDDLDRARRCMGMYLVLNDILVVTQEGLLEKIDGDYKPQLADIRANAESLRADAAKRASQRQYDESQKKTFAANERANAMTVRVADLYSEFLEDQKGNVIKTLQYLRRNHDVAENTYKTVKSTGDLRVLIRSGLNLFDSIRSLSMPKIQIFENDALRKEFEEINKRLRK
ncbi:MAG: hypothetical protein LBO82_10470 [Synergistaceae bacterium]|nr:hypothetical protein [Synergistaceae bacterium]